MTASIEDTDLRHRFVDTNGIRLHVVEAGPTDGPLIVLLHGFPEFWYCWRYQIPALAREGYRVWAPDLRGYNRSDKPDGVGSYTLGEAARDVVGLIEAAGEERAFVVGHDWGGGVGWRLGAAHPDRLRKLVVLNCPNGAALRSVVSRNPDQALRSAYILLFQIPFLPELALKAGAERLLARALRRTSRPGTFSDEDLELYREAWRQPGCLTGMLNWYRALFRGGAENSTTPVETPTLVLWGALDRFLRTELAHRSVEECRDGLVEVLENATHWLQHEEPERVNRAILGFLASP